MFFCMLYLHVPFIPKHANIMPVFNKAYRVSVDNLKKYRVNIITNFMEKLTSKYQCGFRKRFNAQYTVSSECYINGKDLLIKERFLVSFKDGTQ